MFSLPSSFFVSRPLFTKAHTFSPFFLSLSLSLLTVAKSVGGESWQEISFAEKERERNPSEREETWIKASVWKRQGEGGVKDRVRDPKERRTERTLSFTCIRRER